MSWLLISIVAQFVLGTSAVFDKMLLKRGVFDPLVYAFWLGVLGLAAVLVLPFEFHWFPTSAIVEALISGVFFLCAMFYLFKSLHESEASKSLLLIGALTPLTTLLAGMAWLEEGIGIADYIGFSLLVLGGLILFFVEDKQMRWRVAMLAFSSALFFGISNVLAKDVFSYGSFLTGFFWVKMGGVLFSLFCLGYPSLRRRIFAPHTEETVRTHHVWYFLNRWYAALGSILISGAIFLAHPALVEATQGLKFIIIFIASWLLLGEHFKGRALWGKLAAGTAVGIGIIWLSLAQYAFNIPVDRERAIGWGLTFSQKASRGYDVNWQENYKAVLAELKPSVIRLGVYWDDAERKRGEYDFSETDWLMDESKHFNTKIVLSVGMKVPRWPECHIPEWTKGLTTTEREEALLTYMRAVIERYRSHPALSVWQIENEPYLAFGECPARGESFLENEIALVKELDSGRQILTTDGGEFGRWYKAAAQGDIFGTTMYRRTYAKFIGPIVGPTEYPLTPSFFRFKEKIVRWVNGEWEKPFIVVELQAEPWTDKPIKELTEADLQEHFSPDYFRETLAYAMETGFSEYYLWGTEWWYWKKLQGDSRYWDIVKDVMRNKNNYDTYESTE